MKELRNIAIVGRAHPYRGGAALFNEHVRETLAERFEVNLYTFKFLLPKFLYPESTLLDPSKETMRAKPAERLIHSFLPWSWRRAARRIIESRPDVIAFDWWSPVAAFAYASIAKAAKRRGETTILFMAHTVPSSRGAWLRRALTKLAMKRADCFLALSGKVQNDLAELFADKKTFRSELPVIDFAKLGARRPKDLKKELGFEDRHKIVLFFGHAQREKGLDLLIEAFAELVKDDPDFRLLVVGEPLGFEHEYEALVAKRRLEKYVFKHDEFVPNEEVGEFFAAADLVALPYREATQSGTLNMAYNFNKPVVATDVEGLTEFVEDGKTGVVVEPNDPDAIAEGVRRYYALKRSVDFASHIRRRVSENAFNRLPEVFETIFRETPPTS